MATEKTKCVLYNGEISIDFYPNSHQYKLNGVRLDSVTSITGLIDKSRALMKWAEDLARAYFQTLEANGQDITTSDWEHAISLHRQRRDEGADTGKAVHKWIEEWISLTPAKRKKMEMPEDEQVLNGVIAFLDWVKKEDVKFVQSERLVYSRQHGYVGTMDNAYTKGKDKTLYFGDFKTSNYIGVEAILQLVGYTIAYCEEMCIEPKQLAIQHFSKKTGEFKVYSYEFSDELRDGFLALVKAKQSIKVAEKIIRSHF